MQVDPKAVERLIEQLGGIGRNLPPPLPPSDFAGNGGGMEARVAKLEAHVEHIREEIGKLSSMPTNLAIVTTRVDHLPTKGWMVTTLGVGLAVIAALTAFADKIQAFVT